MTTFFLTNETELVIKAQDGDRNAFSELVQRHTPGVINVVYRMCGNQQIAEDAAQETFLQAWLKLSSYQQRSSLRNWLYRIAVNAALDMVRKEKRIHPESVDDMTLKDVSPDPEVSTVGREQSRWVQRAISSLPETSRAVLVLREYEGLSYKEISETLDIPVGTVMSRLNYARNRLREKLEVNLYSSMEVEHV